MGAGAANELWQMDVVGGFLLADGSHAKALTGIDDHSQHCVSAALMARERTRPVCEALGAVNLPNDGKISNLPPDAVVEVPAVVGAAGVTGLAVGPLPEAIAAVLTARVHQQELTVRAALSGSREKAVQALALDPLVPDPRIAAAILDDAIAAHGGTMSRFAVSMPHTVSTA